MSAPVRMAAAAAAAVIALLATGAAAQEAAGGLNPLGGLDKSTLQGFRERPLFAPSRRPPPVETPPAPVDAPVAVAEPPPPAPQPNLRLTGVLEGPDDSIAVVQDLDANVTTQLRLGDMMNGWLVTAIDPVALRLTLGEREEEYRLFDPSRRPQGPEN